MAEPIGALRAELEANSAQFSADMKKARAAAQEAGRGITSSFSAVTAASKVGAVAFKAFQGTLLAVGGTAGLLYVVKSAIEAADAIEDNADAVGLSIKSYQELSFAAASVGLNQEKFQSGMVRLTKAIADARRGTGELVDEFKDSNPALLSAVRNTNSTEDALYTLIGAAEKAGDTASRNAILFGAFGRAAGPEFVKFASVGIAALDKLRERANALGLVLSDDMIHGAGDAADAISQLEFVIKQKLTGALITLAPALTDIIQRFLDGLPTLLKWVDGMGQFFGIIEKSKVAKLTDDIAEVQSQIDLLNNSLNSSIDNFLRSEAGTARLMEKIEGLISRRIELEMELNAAREEQRAPLRIDITKQFDAEADAINKVVRALKEEVAAGQLSADDARIAALAKANQITNVERLREAIQGYIDTLATQREIEKELTALEQKHNEARANAKTLIDDSRTSTQKLADEEKKIIELKQTIIELLGEEGRSAEEADEIINRSLKRVRDNANGAADIGKELGLTFTSAFEDAAVAGDSLRDVVQGLISDIIRLGVRKAFTEPIFSALNPFFEGIGTALMSNKGNVFSSGRVKPFAKGGVSRTMGYFGMAGGVGSISEGNKPEGIFPLARMGNGELGVRAEGAGGGGVSLTIINASGEKAKVQEARNASGGKDITVTIGQVVAKDIRTGGPVSKAIKESFNTTQKTAGR